MDAVLSIVMLTALALTALAVVMWRRGVRRQAGLMALLVVVMIVNVLIWTLPDHSGTAPINQVGALEGAENADR
jgi:hypothetical protein